MPEYDPAARNLPSDPMVRAYLECAEWVGLLPLDGEGTGDDASRALGEAAWPEWSEHSLEKAAEDCAEFKSMLVGRDRREVEERPEQAGQDLWLTRNRHGAGFWDGDWPDAVGERLTEAAHSMGGAAVLYYPEKERLELTDV